MKCLSELFSEKGLLCVEGGVSVNKTGILRLSQNASAEELKCFAQLSSRIGTELTGLKLPLTGSHAEDAVSVLFDDSPGAGCFELRIENGGLTVAAGTSSDMDAAVRYLCVGYPFLGASESFETQRKLLGKDITKAVFRAGSLECVSLGCEGASYQLAPSGETAEKKDLKYDSYSNIVPRLPLNDNFRILWSDLWQEDAEASLQIFVRCAMDCFKSVYPFAVEEKQDGFAYIRAENGSGEIRVDGSDWVFAVSSDGLAPLADCYAGMLQRLKDMESDGWKKDLEMVFSARNELGQAVRLASGKKTGGQLITEGYSAAEIDRKALEGWLRERSGDIALLKSNDPVQVNRWSFEASWEGDDFISLFEKKYLGEIKAGDTVDVEGVLSEDLDVRDELCQLLREKIAAKGAVCGDIRIFRTHKSGCSWVEERVLPAIKKLNGDVASVNIAFHYFVNEYGDEGFDNAPACNGDRPDKPYMWYDIPTRWLQELFPVDEIIERELGISRDDVSFSRSDNAEHTYVLTAYDKNGQALYTDSFDVPFVEKVYNQRYPGLGLCHVDTGRLRVSVNNAPLPESRVETDPEKMWAFVEDTVLPELERYYTSKYDISQLPAKQPLFNELSIDLSFSEMDLDTGIRQERVSTPEALQEDLYFFILDWFKVFGFRECGKELDNVGMVLPTIHNRKREKTTMVVTLSDNVSEAAVFRSNGEELPIEASDCRLELKSIEPGAKPVLNVKADGVSTEAAKAFGELVGKGIAVYPAQSPFVLRLLLEDGSVDIDIPAYSRKASDMTDAERIDILRHDVIDYDTFMRLLDFYARDERLKVIPVGTSFKGRKLYAVELVRKSAGVVYSRYKLENSRITAFFNARHHGNEASSLNGCFLLMDKFLREEEYDKLLDKLNVIWLPFENIDGGEIHCRLIEEHPNWISHMARFNSCGFEFRKDFSNPDTKYGEAKVEMELWKKWLFDVVTDNHGFEGHEMIQPFAGYIAPGDKTFWVPRALYYGYVWYNSQIHHVEAFGRKVRDAVAAWITADKEISGRNAECQERYEKYAKKWFPDIFPATEYKGVVFYWMDTAVRKRANNFAVTNPEITVIDWTTEVADETVHGEEMYMNVRAHLISDLALLEVIKETPVDYDEYRVENGLVKIRRKPLIVE